jgi:outer membrane protein assembly factor BamB
MLSRLPRTIALMVAGLVLLAPGVGCGPRDDTRGRTAVRGPVGAFPPPMPPPLHSAHVVARTLHGPEPLIYGGLAIVPDDSAGVRAVNIRTGAVYWRNPTDGRPMAVHSATGDLFVLGGRDRLTMIDARSGRTRWSRQIPAEAADSRTYGWADHQIVADTGAGAMAILGAKGMAALDRVSGRLRWTRPWPTGHCYAHPFSRVAVTAGTIAVTCNDLTVLPESVAAFDSATGAPRWNIAISALFHRGQSVSPVSVENAGGLLAVGAHASGTSLTSATAIVNPATGKVVVRPAWRNDWSPVAFSGAVQLGECRISTKILGLCGVDPKTGRTLWRSRVPGAGALLFDDESSVAVADGRVYTLSESGDHHHFQMVVFDPHTGKVIGQSRLPHGTGGIEVTAGIAVIQRVSGTDGYELLAEAPELHLVHDLQA